MAIPWQAPARPEPFAAFVPGAIRRSTFSLGSPASPEASGTSAILLKSSDLHGLPDATIEAHGAARVLIRAAFAFMGRRPRLPDAEAFSTHLRRDTDLRIESTPPHRLLRRQ